MQNKVFRRDMFIGKIYRILSFLPFKYFQCSSAKIYNFNIHNLSIICWIYLQTVYSFYCYFILFCFFLFFFFKQQVLISHQFYTHQCIHVNPNSPVHHTTTTPRHFPPLVSICLFSTSVSEFLPCKLVHLYHFSRFHICVLIYDICFSLSDLLHSV